MKICKDCTNRGQKINCQFYNPMSNFAERCPYFEKGRQSKADHIRAMSDEELKKFIKEIRCKDSKSFCSELEHGCYYGCERNHACEENIEELIAEWLQSEVEG